MKNLISFGPFSPRAKFSTWSMRHYGELDFLKPAFIDSDTDDRHDSL